MSGSTILNDLIDRYSSKELIAVDYFRVRKNKKIVNALIDKSSGIIVINYRENSFLKESVIAYTRQEAHSLIMEKYPDLKLTQDRNHIMLEGKNCHDLSAHLVFPPEKPEDVRDDYLNSERGIDLPIGIRE